MARAPILVVGATGNVGSVLVERLVHARHGVRALTRNPKRAAERLGPNVEIVAGDLLDPESLAAALRGVEVASLATTPTPLLGEQEGNFIEAARTAGLRRLVKLSAFGIDFATDWVHAAHARSERRLRASGIAYVVLRPVIFMSNLLFEGAAIQIGQLPSAFGDGAMSFVDPRDVAELMARALVEPRHDGETWEFGGPEALTYDDLAATFTRILGRSIAHVRLDHAGFRAAALGAGLPDFVVEAILDAAAHTLEGDYTTNDEVIRRILGRPAHGFADWVERHRHAFDA
jgi:uncharacterized protein YbjT (DUF2867 family)